MTRPAIVAALLVVLSLGAPLAASAEGGAPGNDRLVMHRIQAGTPDKNGWYDARSTGGKFRVRLPLPFNDYAVRGTSDEPPVWAIGSKSSEGFKFSAVRTSKAVKDPAGELDRFSKSTFQGGATAAVRRLDHRGLPGVELEVKGKVTSAFMRELVLKDGVLLLTVEYPTERKAEIAALVPIFFGSVVVE